MQISRSFGLGAQWAHECGSVVILIVSGLVLFPPSNCTCMLAHSKINSTRWREFLALGLLLSWMKFYPAIFLSHVNHYIYSAHGDLYY